MRSKRIGLLVFIVVCSFILIPYRLCAQSTTAGAVTGTVTDPTGAVVPGAVIILTAPATNETQTTKTDSGGRYTFPHVAPGTYTITASAPSFRKLIITGIDVAVTQTRTIDLHLEVGAVTETIEVVASPMTELQTADASVGVTIGGQELNQLPVVGRSAVDLIFVQPAVAPDMTKAAGLTSTLGGGDVGGGAIAGARSEQVTFSVDGGFATSDLEGSNSYIGPSAENAAVSPIVPVPQDSVQEFRVATNNPSAQLSGGSGGQVAFITKSGTNAFHGSAYEYHQDDGLNANGWTNNYYGIHKPHTVDNRFGADLGGPIKKDKLFFFGFYEGRRFHDSAQDESLVPTNTLKEGILTFNGTQYNLNPANGPLSTGCQGGTVNGTTYTGQCDPRSIGVSPTTLADLALLPSPNDCSVGDQCQNTGGYVFNYPTPIITDIGKLKMDYTINSKWSAFVSWTYSDTTRASTAQVSILNGADKSVSTDPYTENFISFQVQGQLSPQVTSVTHGSYLKNWWGWGRATPSTLGVSGTDQALQLTGEGTGQYGNATTTKLLSDPININTQQARNRIWDGHDWFIAQDFTWVHNKHTFQFGGTGMIWDDYHFRTDDVLGGLTNAPELYVGATTQPDGYMSSVTIPSAFEPAGLTGDQQTYWGGLYATLLGLVDHSTQIGVRNGNFTPLPLGTGLYDNVRIPTFSTYFQDTWKLTSDLTFTMGLDYGVQLTPSEQNGKEVVLTYAGTNQPVDNQQYLGERRTELGEGVDFATGQNLFNPLFSWTPVDSLSGPLHGKMRETAWDDLGPRFAVAWQPHYNNKLFGNHATVIRGGYALIFDRTSAVNEALSPLLTGGLANAQQCVGPVFSSSGAVCSNGTTDPTNAFRIGVDGSSVPVPAPQALPIPWTPTPTTGAEGSSPLFLSGALDPYAKPAHSHAIDLTIQRALPGHLTFEIGYIGRFSRNLPQGESLGAPDFMMKDAKSGQTLAQAFDAISLYERCVDGGVPGNVSGGHYSNGTPCGTLAPQPFFEDLFGPGGTQLVLSDDPNSIAFNGDLGDFMGDVVDPALSTAGLPAIDERQIYLSTNTTDHGWSNYNAMFTTVRKSFSNGLIFQFDWTWSHAIGIQGINQQYIYSNNSPYYPNVDKSSEPFDHKFVLHWMGYYDLPIGRGRTYFHDINRGLDAVIGGWSTSAIFTFYTGAPICITDEFGNFGAIATNLGTCALMTEPLNFKVHYVDGKPNAFADPDAAWSSLEYPLLSQDEQIPYDELRAWNYWNLDLTLAKTFNITEKVKMKFSADAFNVFNKNILAAPTAFGTLDIENPGPANGGSFGAITSQGNTPRVLQLGLRIDF